MMGDGGRCGLIAADIEVKKLGMLEEKLCLWDVTVSHVFCR